MSLRRRAHGSRARKRSESLPRLVTVFWLVFLFAPSGQTLARAAVLKTKLGMVGGPASGQNSLAEASSLGHDSGCSLHDAGTLQQHMSGWDSWHMTCWHSWNWPQVL